MFTYFNDCQTLDEAKSLYKKLAFQHHPDLGGDTATMQAINAEWARFQSEYAYRSERTRQQQAHAEGKKTAADFHNLDEVAEVLRVKIESLLNISSELTVELCGLWVWVTGETKKHREAIKAVEGMRYAPDKQAWYFAAVPSFNRTRRSMDEIRSMHGSQQFTRGSHEEEPIPQSLHA
jgi:hypothetical protein